ncbi:Phage tail fiber repeat [Escherichia coli]|nr:Phage tail fiber repeat [Escherichia coli]
MPGGTVLRGGINSNGVPQSEYKHDMLTSVVDDAKMYLRRFRSSTGASIWHETIENNVYRLCTGTTDAQEELVLRTGSYAKFAGEIISKSANGLRIVYGNYGFFIRNDGSSTYFMLTDSGNSLGTYNRLRPLIINNANGAVTIGNGLNVTGGINGSLNGNAATATKTANSTHNRRCVIRWLRQYQPAGCKTLLVTRTQPVMQRQRPSCRQHVLSTASRLMVLKILNLTHGL